VPAARPDRQTRLNIVARSNAIMGSPRVFLSPGIEPGIDKSRFRSAMLSYNCQFAYIGCGEYVARARARTRR
jgi:hypothetical protein